MQSLLWNLRGRVIPSKLGLNCTAYTLLRANSPTRVAIAATFFGAFGFLLCASPPAAAQLVHQGPKLVGSVMAPNIGTPGEGWSVALSGDGNTAIVGGPQTAILDPAGYDQIGAAWIFTRSGGIWTQQAQLVGAHDPRTQGQGLSVALSFDGNTAVIGGGVNGIYVFTRSGDIWSQEGPMLVANDAGPDSGQGGSVALSADGNTAIMGGTIDNVADGAIWVFTRTGGVWSQQGPALVGNDATAFASLGGSVALSADGNTAIAGGSGDNNNIGAAWVFTRSGGVWTQQGLKLVASDYSGSYPEQGASVALSADGNTAVVGGPGDDLATGAAWVFTRSNGVWTQQGSKLVANDFVYNGYQPEQGSSVALSANGNIAMMGGPGDNFVTGAAWVFTRSNGVWTQQGSKLLPPSDAVNANGLSWGHSVSLSAIGNVAIVGGPTDNHLVGAAWIFASHIAHDFNDDATGDVLWRDTSGNTVVWLVNGGAISQSGGLGAVPTIWGIVGQRDFDGDGSADILWRDNSGNTSIWLMKGVTVASALGLGNVSSDWTLYGTADLNGDGIGDLLWRDSAGDVAIWFLNGGTVASTTSLGNVPATWIIVGDDNKGDIFWHDNAGNYAVWQTSGGQVTGSVGLGNVPVTWQIGGFGDFNGDGYTDILWRDAAGNAAIWFLNSSLGVQSTASLGNVPTNWTVAQTGDYNGDARTDILWTDTSGDLALWFMNGGTVSSTAGLGNVGTTWQVQAVNAE